ncbi:hypothetical protein LTR36_008535 [Oleoguttula mirabilis]|uniref:RNase III domain-containing protein n=1 Tax=Oleoguttula mirabilis TaxID=1507867 RepID=A0AAV9JUI5_9PEZI|nr:hypothetical protein LTR36_008535 [Oleoguttula mirabilis]
MAEDDGLDIDPAIAEAMGFSGFGMQPSSKKRKFDANDTFVDPSVKQDAAPANAQSKVILKPVIRKPPNSLTGHPRLAEARSYIEGVINYTFRDIDLLEEALWACPRVVGQRWLADGNKSLAVVGDSALNLVVADDCYAEGMSRGEANGRLKELVCNKNLAELELAKAIDQRSFVQLNIGMTAMSWYMRATAVEAIIGAVFRDSDGDHGAVKRAVVGVGVLKE